MHCRGWARALAGLLTLPAARAAKAAVQKVFVSTGAPKGYDPTKHKWLMCIDANQVHRLRAVRGGVQKGKRRSGRALISAPGSSATSSPSRNPARANPRRDAGGFARTAGCTVSRNRPCRRTRSSTRSSCPKLCNLCEHPPCVQVCPVGATFDAPDGAVLIDPKYCIGCGFCIQACPYGSRFLNPVTKTAEKCTLCYHRITRGLKPACVEICPAQARIFGDLKNLAAGRSAPEILRKQPGAGAQAASGHRTARALRRPGQGGKVI